MEATLHLMLEQLRELKSAVYAGQEELKTHNMAAKDKFEDHRRKWDRDEYERSAAERIQEELNAQEKAKQKQPPVKHELLRQRDYRVDLESKLGKSVVITKNTPSSQTGGYYCNVCDCVVNFLDHINGKKHLRNLGMSMRVER
jgi:U4/U6.U5 tri-snRNP component SNU23